MVEICFVSPAAAGNDAVVNVDTTKCRCGRQHPARCVIDSGAVDTASPSDPAVL